MFDCRRLDADKYFTSIKLTKLYNQFFYLLKDSRRFTPVTKELAELSLKLHCGKSVQWMVVINT